VTDDAIDAWSDELGVASGAPGELVVRGENVTREYAFEPEHKRAAKIRDGASTWHRMGDVVRIDGEGQLWFLGRKSQRVETAQGPLYPVAIENVFDGHKSIQKSALVGVGPRGAERPWLIVCPEPGSWPNTAYMRDALSTDILRFGRSNPLCALVEGVLFRKSFPVDVRHNAKIDRGALKLWALERVK
jgi:acyl-CoA synthetase (AMP-forming)/AMP-acid ligase II